MSRGCLIGRKLRYFIGAPMATAAAMQALGALDEHCFDGCVTVKLDDSTVWVFDVGSTAVAGPTVIIPTYATGRWLAAGGGSGSGVGAVNIVTVRGASTADIPNLAAFTVAGVDGLTYIEGQRILLKDQTTTEQRGPYRVGVVAGGLAPLTRIGEADASAEVTAGMLVYVSAGTVAQNKWWYLTTDDPIVLDTTGLDFVQLPSYTDLAATTVGLGGDLLGLYDPTFVVTATTIGAAIIENRTALDVAEARVLVNEGELDTHRPGSPMFNRLVMLGAPGAIAAADTVTIGADVYEFRADTPPSGGTAGRIWVYNGATSAVSRANFINAVNNVVDAPNITYDGAVTESMIASAGTLLGTVDLSSAVAVGGGEGPSAVATACTEVLTTAADVWDQATMYGGKAQGPSQICSATVTLSAAMILQGTLEFECLFTPTSASVKNRMRPQTEAYTITGDRVVLTLGGGVAPANQAADVIDVIALG